MNGYITAQEAAEKWGVTVRQVQILCKENRIKGAARMSRIGIIPENAEKPTIPTAMWNTTPMAHSRWCCAPGTYRYTLKLQMQ